MDVQGTVTSIELLRFQWSEAHKNKPKVKVTALCTSHQEGEKKKAGKLGGFFAFRKQSIHSGISLTRQSLRLSSSGRGPEQERALQWVQAVVHAARLGRLTQRSQRWAAPGDRGAVLTLAFSSRMTPRCHPRPQGRPVASSASNYFLCAKQLLLCY